MTFDKEFFDSGKAEKGRYKEYPREQQYRIAKTTAEILFKAVDEDWAGGWSMLDVGCAKGFLVESFHNKGIEAYGVDISHYALKQCEDYIKPFVRQVDAAYDSLPFPDGFFTLITALGVLDYLPNLSNVLHQVTRVLEPGGVFFVSVQFNSHDRYRKVHMSEHGWLKEFEYFGLTPHKWLNHRWRDELISRIMPELYNRPIINRAAVAFIKRKYGFWFLRKM